MGEGSRDLRKRPTAPLCVLEFLGSPEKGEDSLNLGWVHLGSGLLWDVMGGG